MTNKEIAKQIVEDYYSGPEADPPILLKRIEKALEDERAKAKGLVEALGRIENDAKLIGADGLAYMAQYALARHKGASDAV